MTPELRALYQDVILEHGRRPRNYGRLAGATHEAEGYNPLCGDRFTVQLLLEGDRVREIAFSGQGCAISKASASLLTTHLKDSTRDDVVRAFGLFHDLVTTGRSPEGDVLGKLGVFSGVHEFPARVKCATLAWHALRAALEGKREAISTE